MIFHSQKSDLWASIYGMWHIIPWWYTHMPNKVWLCQRTEKLRYEHKAMSKNLINLTLRSKIKVVSGSWMYWTLSLMVIDPCVKYGMPMSKLTEVTGRTWRHDDTTKAYKFDLKVKGHQQIGINIVQRLMVIHPCAK